MEKEKVAKSKPGTQPAHPTPGASRTPSGVGHGQNFKLHLKKAMQGPEWTHIKLKNLGPDVGKKYEPPI